MSTKLIRTILITLQVIISASILLGCICGIIVSKDSATTKLLIEGLIRSVAALGFTVFYYVSVSDSFSADTLIFPIYLLCITTSESRTFEIVEGLLNLFFIPQHFLVEVLIFSSFMIAFTLIGYALLSNNSKKENNLFTIAAIVASLTIATLAPKAQTITEAWNSKSLFVLLASLFTTGVIISIVQAILETSTSTRIKYVICILLFINEFINLVFNSDFMNAAGTVLFIVSLVLVVLLVRMNATRL